MDRTTRGQVKLTIFLLLLALVSRAHGIEERHLASFLDYPHLESGERQGRLNSPRDGGLWINVKNPAAPKIKDRQSPVPPQRWAGSPAFRFACGATGAMVIGLWAWFAIECNSRCANTEANPMSSFG